MRTTVPRARHARVLYDGRCAFCRQSVDLLRRLDWFGKLRYVDIRDPQQLAAVDVQVAPDRLIEEMHLIPPEGGRVYHGFGAIRWIAWRLPPLLPLAPLLSLPGVPAIGQRLYLWVARRRFQLVPCHGGVCSLPANPK